MDCDTDWSGREEDNRRAGVYNNYEHSANECCSSSVGGGILGEIGRAPSAVSVRVRQGRWRFYAVRRGRRVGVFRTWPECEMQVRYYSGAVFKGFNTEEDAIAFMGGTGWDV